MPDADEVVTRASDGQLAAVNHLVRAVDKRLHVDERGPLKKLEERLNEVLGAISFAVSTAVVSDEEADALLAALTEVDHAHEQSSGEDTEGFRSSLGELIHLVGTFFDRRWGDDFGAGNNASALQHRTSLERLLLLLRAEDSLAQAEDSLSNIEAVESSVRVSAGEVSTVTLAGHFADNADKEERAANLLRASAVGLGLLAAVMALALPLGDSISSVEAIRRLAFVLPLILIAGYLGREGGQHRFVSRDLRSTEVKLRALMAYAQVLPEQEQRSLFLEKVGLAMFMAPSVQPGQDAATQPVAEMEALMARVTELVRAASSRP